MRVSFIVKEVTSQGNFRRILSSLALRGMQGAASAGADGPMGGLAGAASERALVRELRAIAPFFMRASDAELTSAQLLL